MLHKLLLLCSFAIHLGCGEEEKESAVDIRSEVARMASNYDGAATVQFEIVNRS